MAVLYPSYIMMVLTESSVLFDKAFSHRLK